jgi:hypothetical protein
MLRSSRLNHNHVSPRQFRTGEPVDYSKLRVFGCPAKIFIRPSDRVSLHPKLGNRSEQGTLLGLGMSDKGNGYIFQIKRYGVIVEVDSEDAFNPGVRMVAQNYTQRMCAQVGPSTRRGTIRTPGWYRTTCPNDGSNSSI